MSIGNIAVQEVSLRDVLRDRTRDTHQMLHRHSSFVALFKQRIELSDYRQLVQFLHGFYAPLDAAIQSTLPASCGALSGYDYQSRSEMLEKDLRAFGFTDGEIHGNARCSQAHYLVTPSTIGGVLYVVEGATLGGSAIDRAVARILPQSSDIGGRYYWSWCRAENARCWANIMTYLDDVPMTEKTIESHIKGANDTFQAFANWMAPLHRAERMGQKGVA